MSGQKNQRTKYFIGIVVPAPIGNEIEKIKLELLAEHNLKGGLRSPSHITLHRPFEWRSDKEDELIGAFANFSPVAGFTISLKGFDFFPPRVIFVNVEQSEALFSLHMQLTSYAKQHLKLYNESDDLRGFHPHVTIAFRDLKRKQFEELRPQFQTREFTGSFMYSGFSLLKLDKTWKEHYFFPSSHPVHPII